MSEKKDKNQESGKEIIKDINSVPKMSEDDREKYTDVPHNPARGGRKGAESVQDGGQDVGSSAGSH